MGCARHTASSLHPWPGTESSSTPQQQLSQTLCCVMQLNTHGPDMTFQAVHRQPGISISYYAVLWYCTSFKGQHLLSTAKIPICMIEQSILLLCCVLTFASSCVYCQASSSGSGKAPVLLGVWIKASSHMCSAAHTTLLLPASLPCRIAAANAAAAAAAGHQRRPCGD
jgi:hypothetical protein